MTKEVIQVNLLNYYTKVPKLDSVTFSSNYYNTSVVWDFMLYKMKQVRHIFVKRQMVNNA